MKLTQTAGDMAIKDLTPKTTNLGDRIVKNMRICGSGIYTYARQEADLLHLSPVPEKYKDITTINVFRPPEVLEKFKDIFARVPIITGRHVLVTPQNAKSLTVGMVGDTVESEVDKDDGETYLYTTGTIVAGDGIEAYEQYGQLSVGYDPIIEWEEGVHKGVQYQAVLKGFKDVNHLLICKVARGGPQCMVMDSLDTYSPLERFINTHSCDGGKMNIFEKIFGGAKTEKIAGDAAIVSTLLQSIAVGADPATQVSKIRSIAGDSDTVFNGYLDELSGCKGEDLSVVAKAVKIVDDYYVSHLAGDEKPVEEKKPEEKKPEEKKPEAGDAAKDDKKPEEAGNSKSRGTDDATADLPKPEEKKQAGDAIDYDLLATKVAEKMAAAKAVSGDAAPDVEEPGVALNGDQASDSKGSDDLMKDIWG